MPGTPENYGLLRWQFEYVWSLLELHLAALTDEDTFWEPVPGSWTVHRGPDGLWRPDWVEPEPEDVPGSTIGWITWHIGWWWTEALAAVSGAPLPPRSEVHWPGSTAAAVEWIRGLADRWRTVLADPPDVDRVAPFPWTDRPDRTLGHLLYWLNGELMKNAAELGQLRLTRLAATRG